MTTQATPPSEAQQLADARTALAVHIARIAELEEIVNNQRELIALMLKVERKADYAIGVLERYCGEMGQALAVVEEKSLV